MPSHPSESNLAYFDPEKGEGDPLTLTAPPQARTTLDVRDRSSNTERPFLTFDFEPEDCDLEVAYRTHISRRTEPRPDSSHVSIDHFDPEGIKRAQVQSRFSEVSLSEYYDSGGQSFGHPSTESIPQGSSEESLGDACRTGSYQPTTDKTQVSSAFTASEATLVPASTASQSQRSSSPKRRGAVMGMELAMREALKR